MPTKHIATVCRLSGINGPHHICFSISPTSGKSSKFEVLSNVKGQMSSWIGSVQVPSVPNLFNKGGDSQTAEATAEPKAESPTAGEANKDSSEPQKDEDDNSRYVVLRYSLCFKKSMFYIMFSFFFI